MGETGGHISPPGSPMRTLPKHTFQSTVALMRNPQGPPLDYSFLDIKLIEELREVMPRSGFRKQPPETIEDEAGAQIPNVSAAALSSPPLFPAPLPPRLNCRETLHFWIPNSQPRCTFVKF